MTTKQISLLVLTFLLAFLMACDPSREEPDGGKYATGLFVVNEGLFGGTGTITWHDPTTNTTVQDVYGAANGGAALGEFPQSLTLDNGFGYIPIGNSSRIVVVRAGTFEYVDTIGGLHKPRYLLSLGDGTALVSQWGDDGLAGSVARVNLTTRKVIQTSIVLGQGSDRMLRLNDSEVMVANSGGFGVDSTVVLLDVATLALKRRFTLPANNPGSLVRLGTDNTAAVYALCKASYLESSPRGWLGPVTDPNAGLNQPPYGEDLCASPSGAALYFSANGAVQQWQNGAVSVLAAVSAYGLACHPASGWLYCADGKDFNSAGEVVVLRPDGTRVRSFAAGIAPGEVVFID